MTYGSYLVKCCDEVEQAREYDSDSFLVALVKMQQLLGRAADVLPYGDDDASRRVNYAPIHMALTAVRKELDALVRVQPPEVECNCTSSVAQPLSLPILPPSLTGPLTNNTTALLWTHYHGTICRLYEPAIYIRSTSAASATNAGDPTARTSALWACLDAARDFFAAYTAIPTQNLVCIPFHSAHLSFTMVTASRLLFLGDETAGSNNPRDPDWAVSVARDHLALDAQLARLAEFFDEADRLATGLGRRGRYVDADKSVLGMYRERVRWIRSWYLGRTAGRPPPPPGGAAGEGPWPGPYLHDARSSGRREGAAGGGDLAKDVAGGSGGGAGTVDPGGSGINAQAQQGGGGGGQAMDVDYGIPSQLMMPGELDETFWQAMFDMSGGSGVDWMDVQA